MGGYDQYYDSDLFIVSYSFFMHIITNYYYYYYCYYSNFINAYIYISILLLYSFFAPRIWKNHLDASGPLSTLGHPAALLYSTSRG